MNSPCLVSVVHLAYFVVFGGFSRRVIVQQPTAEFEINISDRSFVTNATYQTDAQSKFSVKIQPSQGENFDCASVW